MNASETIKVNFDSSVEIEGVTVDEFGNDARLVYIETLVSETKTSEVDRMSAEIVNVKEASRRNRRGLQSGASSTIVVESSITLEVLDVNADMSKVYDNYVTVLTASVKSGGLTNALKATGNSALQSVTVKDDSLSVSPATISLPGKYRTADPTVAPTDKQVDEANIGVIAAISIGAILFLLAVLFVYMSYFNRKQRISPMTFDFDDPRHIGLSGKVKPGSQPHEGSDMDVALSSLPRLDHPHKLNTRSKSSGEMEQNVLTRQQSHHQKEPSGKYETGGELFSHVKRTDSDYDTNNSQDGTIVGGPGGMPSDYEMSSVISEGQGLNNQNGGNGGGMQDWETLDEGGEGEEEVVGGGGGGLGEGKGPPSTRAENHALRPDNINTPRMNEYGNENEVGELDEDYLDLEERVTPVNRKSDSQSTSTMRQRTPVTPIAPSSPSKKPTRHALSP